MVLKQSVPNKDAQEYLDFLLCKNKHHRQLDHLKYQGFDKDKKLHDIFFG